jgi:hypothetical protein
MPGRWQAALTCSALLLAGSVSAQEKMPEEVEARGGQAEEAGACPDLLGRIDRDGNGIISESEASFWEDALFRAYDRDGDGMVTRAEYLACPGVDNVARTAPPPGEESDFRALDTDANGRVSYLEYLIAGEQRFLRAARDPQGRITPESYAQALGPLVFDLGSADRDGDGFIVEDEASADVARGFLARDRNRSFALLLPEWTSVAAEPAAALRDTAMPDHGERQFAAMDINNDGRLGHEEFGLAAGERWQTARFTAHAKPLSVWIYRIHQR